MSLAIWATWTLAVVGSFLALEIPALRKGRRWTTYSEQLWRIPKPIRYLIWGFLIDLGAHIVFHSSLTLTSLG